MDALFRRLDAGMGYSLTLVLAPAGTGKTALLRRWLAARNWSAAWMALDAADNDKAHFVQHLLAATQPLRSEPSLLADPALPEENICSHRTGIHEEQGDSAADDDLATWLNSLAERGDDVVLVLDGYEQIEADAVHDAVRLMLDYPPPGLHLYLASRTEPPLQLPRLRVRRQLLEVKLA